MRTDPVLAERLPTLYRAALDATDALARRGRRFDAARLRNLAVVAYGRPWDDRALRALEDVLRRAELPPEAGEPRGAVPGPSTSPAR